MQQNMNGGVVRINSDADAFKNGFLYAHAIRSCAVISDVKTGDRGVP